MQQRQLEHQSTDNSYRARLFWSVLAGIFTVATGLDLYLAVDQQVSWPIVAAVGCCAGAVLSAWQAIHQQR